jgi:dihydrofolate reductase
MPDRILGSEFPATAHQAGVSLIAAVSSNGVIGRSNQLLWRLPEDTRYFKNRTWGMPVIMGRKTLDSLAGKPLPGRYNIVVSHQPPTQLVDGRIRFAASIDEALILARDTGCLESFFIGGGQLYAAAFPLADRIYLTRVHAEFQGDARFPAFSDEGWRLAERRDYAADSKNPIDMSFEIWIKR